MLIFNNKTPQNIKFNGKRVRTLKINDTVVWKMAELPEEYTLLNYIESTGTQYIDTGLVGKPGYTIEATLAFTKLSTGSYQYFAGYAYTGSTDRTYFIRINNSSDHLGYTYGSTVESKLLTIEERTFYDIKSSMKANKQEFSVDGVSLNTSTYEALSYDETNPKYIYMFASQYIETFNGQCNVRCKEAKWYNEEGILVRHYVPCYRNSDEEAGMYDLVNGVFYTNQGEGEFVKGRIFPIEGYQQVEYVEATGTQFTELNYYASSKTSSKGTFQITDINVAAMLFGSRRNGTSFFYGFNWGGGQPFKYYNSWYNGQVTTKEIDNEIHTFEKKVRDLYIDGEILSTNTNTTIYECSYKTIVFGCNTGGTIALFSKARIYDLQFLENGIPVIDLVPCYRKSDGEIGFYDLVNDVFYTNKGTGTFLKGKDV